MVGAQLNPVHATTGLWTREVGEPCRFVCGVGGRRMGRWKLAWQWGEVVRTRLLGP